MNNIEPLIVLTDGSELWVSTRHSGDGSFSCELYLSTRVDMGDRALRSVSTQFEAPSCLGAQELAYNWAVRLYPDGATSMKTPPYLIWPGPHQSVRPSRRS